MPASKITHYVELLLRTHRDMASRNALSQRALSDIALRASASGAARASAAASLGSMAVSSAISSFFAPKAAVASTTRPVSSQPTEVQAHPKSQDPNEEKVPFVACAQQPKRRTMAAFFGVRKLKAAAPQPTPTPTLCPSVAAAKPSKPIIKVASDFFRKPKPEAHVAEQAATCSAPNPDFVGLQVVRKPTSEPATKRPTGTSTKRQAVTVSFFAQSSKKAKTTMEDAVGSENPGASANVAVERQGGRQRSAFASFFSCSSHRPVVTPQRTEAPATTLNLVDAASKALAAQGKQDCVAAGGLGPSPASSPVGSPVGLAVQV